jgi:hypothetical protein
MLVEEVVAFKLDVAMVAQEVVSLIILLCNLLLRHHLLLLLPAVEIATNVAVLITGLLNALRCYLNANFVSSKLNWRIFVKIVKQRFTLLKFRTMRSTWMARLITSNLVTMNVTLSLFLSWNHICLIF